MIRDLLLVLLGGSFIYVLEWFIYERSVRIHHARMRVIGRARRGERIQ